MATLAFVIVPTGREVAAAFTARAEAAHRAAGVAGCSGVVGLVGPVALDRRRILSRTGISSWEPMTAWSRRSSRRDDLCQRSDHRPMKLDTGRRQTHG